MTKRKDHPETRVSRRGKRVSIRFGSSPEAQAEAHAFIDLIAKAMADDHPIEGDRLDGDGESFP